MAPATSVRDNDAFERRQQRLMLLAWGATLLPLLAFGYLTWASWNLEKQNQQQQTTLKKERAQLDDLLEQKARAQSDLATLNAELKEQRNSAKHYRDFAGIRIRFYRDSDRAVVQKALLSLGYRIESELGTSPLIDRKPNTIAYGSFVAPEDYRDIAVALVQAGFPLKRIAPATRQPDPKLIQIYASAESDGACGLLSVDEIRDKKTCGALSSSSTPGE